MNKKFKIVSFDLETSPNKGYFFGKKWETNIIEMIEYEQILCVAYTEHGSGKVHVIGQDDFPNYKKGVLNDKELVMFLRPIIEDADIVSAHNGDRFDIPFLNTRLLAHGLKPIPPYKSLDTKKIAKSTFHLPSNKLDDIADFLGIGRKLSTHKSLWLDCEKGDEKAWKYMKQYCKFDVVLQDEVLERILPYSKQVHNFNAFTDEPWVARCKNVTCGSTHLQKRGFDITNSGVKSQRFQCQDCGTWSKQALKENAIVK
jgi:DNA polymerase elongation subunit (family B)